MQGRQIPRIQIEPERIDTDGKGAAMLMQAYGLTLDAWQQLILNAWLGVDAEGQYTATSCGLSVPRQNGKNVCLEARELYGLVINGERIVHTAHRVNTTRKAFGRLESMFTDKRNPEIVKAVKKIKYGVGEESIRLKNGGQIEFMSRSRQGARGYDGISVIICDEAQELTDEQLEALMSTLSASATGTRQIIYCGTPPYVGCTGEVFKRFRQGCIDAAGNGEPINTCWHEWSIAANSIEDIDVNNKALWYEANPALGGGRLIEEFTAEEARTLSADGFARERLGVWLKYTATPDAKVINEEAWNACRSDEEKPDGKTAYGVKFSADGGSVVLAGCVIDNAGIARITVIRTEPTGRGLKWLAEWLNERYKVASCVVIDGKNGSDVLIDKLTPVWIFKDSIKRPKAQDVITAATLLVNEINEKTLTWYSKQDALNESALTATKRAIGAGWGFGGSGAELIEACSLALWGCRTSKRNPQRQMRIG